MKYISKRHLVIRKQNFRPGDEIPEELISKEDAVKQELTGHIEIVRDTNADKAEVKLSSILSDEEKKILAEAEKAAAAGAKVDEDLKKKVAKKEA